MGVQDMASMTGTGSILSTLLALSAMFLALSVVVQIVQEIFKYLRSSKSGIYRSVLIDALGGWVDQIALPESKLPLARGPFQFFRSKPGKVLLPLGKEELKAAVDDLAPNWIGVALQELKAEAALQQDAPGKASPRLGELVKKLELATEEEDRNAWNARILLEFLKRTDFKLVPESSDAPPENLAEEDASIDASRILAEFYREFLPQRAQVERHFDQIQTNFTYTCRRHNTRVTFVIGLLIAFFLNFPFNGLLEKASKLTPTQAIALAESTLAYYEENPDLWAEEGEEKKEKDPRKKAKELYEASLQGMELIDEQGNLRQRFDDAKNNWWPKKKPQKNAQEGKLQPTSLGDRIKALMDRILDLLGHLVQSALTALMVSFGAPFWDRATKTLLRASRPGSAPKETANAES